MKNLILFSSLLFSTVISAETTRMKSSANIGVGSILLDEATFLNPASSAFFKIGAIYYQKSETESVTGEKQKSGSNIFIASDAKGKMAGSISYTTNDSNKDYKNIAVSLASIVGERSATGITYHYEDGNEKTKYLTFGVTHAISEFFTLGFVLNDPLREREERSNFMIGTQYTYQDFIALMADFGTDWKDRFDEKMIYGGAIQFKVFDDLFIRGGIKRDKQNNTQITGFGGSWASPRFVFNASLNFLEDLSLKTEEKETTFSLSYKF